MDFIEFKNILNNKIFNNSKSFKNILNNKILNNSKSDLIKKNVENSDMYIGLFRSTRSKVKLLQNLLQSNKIRFGDVLEILFGKYFEILSCKVFKKNIKTNNKYLRKYFNLKEYFSIKTETIYKNLKELIKC
jgi:hypothetical protein